MTFEKQLDTKSFPIQKQTSQMIQTPIPETICHMFI